MFVSTHNPYAVYEDSSTCPVCTSENGVPHKASCQDPVDMPSETSSTFNSNNVYVSNLLPELNENWLRKEFSRFGLITSAKIMTKNGVSKGYGFVQFIEPDMALAAVQALNGSYVGEHCIACKLADRDKDRGALNQPSNNLYIGNLPTTWGVGEVSELFGIYGPISSLVVLSDPVTGGSRGVSLVRFHTVEDGTACIEALHGVVLEGHDRPLEVKYAETSTEKHMRKSGKKRNPMPKRAANTRSRGRAVGEPRASNSRAHRENSPNTANAGRSSSNSSASNGTQEVESPVSLGFSMPSGPSAMRTSSFGAAEAAACAPRVPSVQLGPQMPILTPGLAPHPFLLRPTAMVPMRSPPPVLCKPPMFNPGHLNTLLSQSCAPLLSQISTPSPLRNAMSSPGFPRMPEAPLVVPQAPVVTPMGSRGAVLKVSGLPTAHDEVSLYKLFTPFGAVESVTIPNIPTGPGTAFVRFRLAKDAAMAVNHLQGAVLQNQMLQVAFH